MNFGENLKKARINAGLSQVKVSEILNISQSNISKYEKNELEPNVETIRKMAILYKTPIEKLFDL